MADWLRTVNDADLSISALTVREITKGVAKLRAKKPDVAAKLDKAVARIFDAFEGRIWPIDCKIAAVWGEALAANEKHVDDAALAATALVQSLIVVTRNIRDFDGRGVKLVDPFRTVRKPRV